MFFFKLFFANYHSKIKSPPFFILGSGRNGSTLLSSILNAHPELFIPSEQFILPYTIMRRYLYFFLPVSRFVRSIRNMILVHKKTTNWNVDLSEYSHSNKNISENFDKIYQIYAKQRNKTITFWGDKTPLNTNFIKFIYPEFKTAKYIFLIRDPRDTILSYQKFKGHNSSKVNFAIWKWNDSIKTFHYLREKTNVLLVKYENLVSDPDSEIKRITRFIGVSIINNLHLSKLTASDMSVGKMKHHQNLNKPISNKSVGKWKEELSRDDIILVENECLENLKRFEYWY